MSGEKKGGNIKRPFPECAKDCEILPLLGAGECENVCPEKFKKQEEK